MHHPCAAFCNDQPVAEPLSFACPRCARDVSEPFYGPCADCRDQLRSTFAGEARTDVEAEAYEPKMNVTPNAVALKE
jgi:hypothetical protein